MKTLLSYARNVHSQRGEDGILEKIIEILTSSAKITIPHWCVEFGAWDGKHLSNTHHLMSHGWSGVFIEGDPLRYQDLVRTYEGNTKAHCIQRFVEFAGGKNGNTLDAILAETPIPKDFAVLSVDIDGNDYHIWESLQVYGPAVVVIEYNPSIPPNVTFVQAKDMDVHQGSSLKALVELGKKKGYELIVATSLNAFFVKKEFFPPFYAPSSATGLAAITDNSPEALFQGQDYITQVFQGYDGKIFFTGAKKMLWHGVPIRDSFQPIPRVFRVFPSVMGPVRLFLFRVWRRVCGMVGRG